MTILKLQNEGDTYTGIVTSCNPVQGQYGAQVEFVFHGGDKLFLPKDSADRQLDRLSLDYEGAAGQSLTFSRDHNPKKGAKPYWGISYGTKAAPPAQQPQSNRVASPYVPPKEVAPPRQPAHPAPGFGGAHIPDMDDPGPQDPDDPYRNVPGVPMSSRTPNQQEPARTPREEREAATGVSDRERQYLACWSRVAEHQVREGKRLGFPVDGSSIQASCFSIFGGR